MVRDQLSDDVAMNYIFPPVNDDLGSHNLIQKQHLLTLRRFLF